MGVITAPSVVSDAVVSRLVCVWDFDLIACVCSSSRITAGSVLIVCVCCPLQGFGAGNFKALFEAIELEQAKRGNL